MPKNIRKLNCQALARKDSLLMECLLPNPGNVIVSQDLIAGEPTVTGNFSRDPNYLYATYSGVGKAPFYDNGILFIDDIYLMVASVATISRDIIAESYNKRWPAGSFTEQWLTDPEVIKKELKTIRNVIKILALGLGYGMGPNKMVDSLYEKGFEISHKDAKAFRKIYWELFKGVKTFAEQLEALIDQQGYYINPFGYRITCESRKAYNYFCQSSVSGIINIYAAKLFAAAPYAVFLTCIHDELLIEVPEDKIEDFKEISKLALKSLNDDLAWFVPVRMGFVTGRNWYEAK